jgi:hypothetical protein
MSKRAGKVATALLTMRRFIAQLLSPELCFNKEHLLHTYAEGLHTPFPRLLVGEVFVKNEVAGPALAVSSFATRYQGQEIVTSKHELSPELNQIVSAQPVNMIARCRNFLTSICRNKLTFQAGERTKYDTQRERNYDIQLSYLHSTLPISPKPVNQTAECGL